MPEQAAVGDVHESENESRESAAPVSSQAALPPGQPVAAGPGQRKTFLEKASLVMGMVIPAVLGWATWSLTNQQWQTQQRQYQNSTQEQDRSRVMDRLMSLGASSVTDRLAAAKALRSYADLNWMDAAMLPALLPYLKSECDDTVFRIEKEAALQAATNSPAQSPPDVRERRQVAPGMAAIRQTLAGISAINKSPDCPKESSPVTPPPAPAGTTVITAPPQYFEVGCGDDKTGVLEVPLPGAISANQSVRDVSATLANIDNLKAWSVRVLGHTDHSGTVEYRLVGLDRQFLGNCPGGGHGSVVTSFTLGPK